MILPKGYKVNWVATGVAHVEFNGDFNGTILCTPKKSKAYGSPLWKVMNGDEETEDSLSERRCGGQAERDDTTTQEPCKKATKRIKNSPT